MSGRFERFLPGKSPAERCRLEALMGELAPHLTELHWAEIAVRCWDEWEAQCADPADAPHRAFLERQERRQASHGAAQSTSTSSGRVELLQWSDDPLKRVPASVYLPLISGVEVSATGTCRCPHPDHEDRHPSCKAYGPRWKCFACGAGGTVIDLGELYSGIPASGASYWELRDWIIDRLGSEVSP
jgi:hypothetical protein